MMALASHHLSNTQHSITLNGRPKLFKFNFSHAKPKEPVVRGVGEKSVHAPVTPSLCVMGAAMAGCEGAALAPPSTVCWANMGLPESKIAAALSF